MVLEEGVAGVDGGFDDGVVGVDGVDVDYTPTAVKSFQDGAPTQITMILSFQETELITKEKVNAGY